MSDPNDRGDESPGRDDSGIGPGGLFALGVFALAAAGCAVALGVDRASSLSLGAAGVSLVVLGWGHSRAPTAGGGGSGDPDAPDDADAGGESGGDGGD